MAIIKIKGKYRVHLQGLPFHPRADQIFFYDPQPDSYLSYLIEEELPMIKSHFAAKGFEFYCFSDLAQQMTDEMVRYRFPNWRSQPLNKVGNDLLRTFLAEEDQDIGASFIRLYDSYDGVYSCYQLYHPDTYSLDDQLEFYSKNIKVEEPIRYSIASNDECMLPVYEGTFNFADENFEKESQRLNEIIAQVVKQLHQQNVNEFVLRCLVPVEEKLSRLVVTSDYDIVLPDYGKDPIPMTPLPKAVFLLFLRHEEGIYFKELGDSMYVQELWRIYSKVSNRTTDAVVARSLADVTDPTKNAINEKCSRIREAFLGRMDERIAQHYFVTGKRGEVKRITLPRNLVEWQCEI